MDRLVMSRPEPSYIPQTKSLPNSRAHLGPTVEHT